MSLSDGLIPDASFLPPALAKIEDKWTAENVELLRQLIASGISSSQVATKLSCETGIIFTRNMVIGKARRMNMPLLGLHKAEKKIKNLSVRIVKLKKKFVPTPPQGPTLAEVVAFPKLLTILEIGQGQCYWPTSHAFDIDPKDIRFCGHATDNGDSWCRAHKKIGYTEPARRMYGQNR